MRRNSKGHCSCQSLRLALTLPVMLLAACASQTLTDGATLATAGQTAASQMSGSVSLSSTSLKQVRTALAFEEGYNNQIGSTKELQTKIIIYQKNLAIYSKMLLSLNSAYSALGSLSGYDAAGNFNSSINGLAADVNAFAQAVGSKTTPISPAASSIVGEVGGKALAAYQAHQIKKASSQISLQLSQIIAVLSEPNVRRQVVPAQELIQRDISQAATALFDAHLYSYAPLVDEMGAPLGLESLPDADETAAREPRVSKGLRNVEEAESEFQVEAISQLYDTNLNALRALLPLHRQLEQGQRLNTAAISELLSEIEAIATQIKQNSAAVPAQKGN